MRIRMFEDREEWIQAVVEELVKSTDQKSGSLTIGLSGGRTPRPIYTAFAQKIKNPENIHLYIADERYVPREHPESNAGMIHESFSLSSDKDMFASVHDIDTSLPLHEAVKQYDDEIKKCPKDFLDILFLGIGPDGHILSLFPYTDGIHEVEHAVIHTTTDRFAIHDRITMTGTYIKAAKYIILAASGSDKLPVIEDLKIGSKTVDESPVMMLRNHPHLDIFYLK